MSYNEGDILARSFDVKVSEPARRSLRLLIGHEEEILVELVIGFGQGQAPEPINLCSLQSQNKHLITIFPLFFCILTCEQTAVRDNIRLGSGFHGAIQQ